MPSGPRSGERLSARSTPALRGLFLLALCSFLHPAAHAATWYVNDLSVVGDIFTGSTGSDTNPGTAANPFRTITKADSMAVAGDTIIVDAGSYLEAVFLDTNNITLQGAGNATTIDPPGVSTTSGIVAVYLSNCSNVVVRNIRCIGAYYGFYLWNTDSSTLSGVTATANTTGIYLQNGSDSNRITGSTSSSNSLFGFHSRGSSYNTISNCVLASNSNTGIVFDYTSPLGTITGNTVSSSPYGIFVQYSSNTTTISFNAVTLTTTAGIYAQENTGNVIMNNIVNSNSYVGIYLHTETGDSVSNNTASSNSAHGIYTWQNTGTVLDSNVASSNGNNGLYLQNSSGHLVRRNRTSGNGHAGIWLKSTTNSVVTANTIDSNTIYQVVVEFASSSDTITKNNILNPGTGSYIYSGATTGATFDARRNWFGTTDKAAIAGKMSGAQTALMTWEPFRLGIVDTNVGADTVAPATPTAVTVDTTLAGRIRVSWTLPVLDEEGTALTGFSRVRVYRDTNPTKSDWRVDSPDFILTATDTTWNDTTVTLGTSYYYRVTAVDMQGLENEAFFSDTKLGVAPNGTVTITAPLDGHDTTLSPITLSGTSMFSIAGDSVTVYRNGILQSTGVVQGGGGWSCTTSLAAIADSIEARLTRLGVLMDTERIRVDFYGVPSVTISAPTAGHDTNVSIITVSGTTSQTSLGDSIGLYRNGIHQSTTTVSSTGSWSCTTSLGAIGDSINARLITSLRDTANDTIHINFYNGPVWFVNDASTVGDSFTSSIGRDTGRGDSSAPFRTIAKALSRAQARETIYVDRGTFTESVVFLVDSTTLIGAGDETTIVDPPGESTTGGIYAFNLTGRRATVIRDVQATGAEVGFRMSNTDSSLIESSYARLNSFGVDLEGGSDFNLIRNVRAERNSAYGYYLGSSSNNIIRGGRADTNTTTNVLISTSA
ncbi:MAG: NosD domain-containing protein, partial [Candidatus Hydrogenedentota bacterium]